MGGLQNRGSECPHDECGSSRGPGGSVNGGGGDGGGSEARTTLNATVADAEGEMKDAILPTTIATVEYHMVLM